VFGQPVKASVFENGPVYSPNSGLEGGPPSGVYGVTNGGTPEHGNGVVGSAGGALQPVSGLSQNPVYTPPSALHEQQQQAGAGYMQQQQQQQLGVGAGAGFTAASRSPSPAAAGAATGAPATVSPGGSVQMAVRQGQQSPGQRWGSETDGEADPGLQSGTRV
jgi:hypothetical protein